MDWLINMFLSSPKDIFSLLLGRETSIDRLPAARAWIDPQPRRDVPRPPAKPAPLLLQDDAEPTQQRSQGKSNSFLNI